MRRSLSLVASSLAVISLSTPASAQVAGDKIPGSYICVFKAKSVGRGGEQAAAAAASRAVGGQVSHVYTAALQGFAARIPDQAVERMKAADARIDYCEQDQVMSLGPIRVEAKPSRGGTGTQPAQSPDWGVVRVLGGTSFPSGPFTGRAWVLDTGIDLHPDLNVDTARSRSFLTTTSYVDQNGHGTHVAGTIAARNNTIGVVGVAPGAPVVAVRVLDARGSGTTSGVIAGVDYVANNAVQGDVANMSLGGGISTALDAAVTAAAAKQIRFAIAAGNSATFAGNSSPARVEAPNVYTVSAFGSRDVFASFSNYGNPPVDYAEPGVSIRSTWLGGGYNTISGTSMAAPHLAGLLLLGGISVGGYVTGDPDGNADRIGVR